MSKVTQEQKLRAFRRGSESGRRGKPFVSPYTRDELIDQWIHGYQVAQRQQPSNQPKGQRP